VPSAALLHPRPPPAALLHAATGLPFLVLPVRIREHEQLELNNSVGETRRSSRLPELWKPALAVRVDRTGLRASPNG
jgi:hypothetical protein